MTAGRGVIHSEMPSKRVRAEGGTVHGFQLWVNLPARDKMIEPLGTYYAFGPTTADFFNARAEPFLVRAGCRVSRVG
jgi:hypothetical protein